MSSPLVTLEEWQREREELSQRLAALNAGGGGEQHQNFQDTTGEQIESLRSRIEELNGLIANIGAPHA